MATNGKVEKIGDKSANDCGFLHKTLM